MRRRRCIVNAKDIGRIAVIGLYDSYAGFKNVFDFLWPIDRL